MEQRFEPADEPEPLFLGGRPAPRSVDHASHAARCREQIRATKATRDPAGRPLNATPPAE